MSFQIMGLPADHFGPLFALSDAELAARGAVRQIADGRTPGYPCRVSLTDSQQGDELLLVNYEHPRSIPPIACALRSTCAAARSATTASTRCRSKLRVRTLAVRAYDADAMLVGWELVEGRDLERAIEKLLANRRADYLHIHFAAPGCYAARVGA